MMEFLIMKNKFLTIKRNRLVKIWFVLCVFIIVLSIVFRTYVYGLKKENEEKVVQLYSEFLEGRIKIGDEMRAFMIP